MSEDGSIEIVWAGDERKFRLGIDELCALQDKRDAGPLEIARRLIDGTWRVQDIQETIRLALLGAGVDAKLAKGVVEDHVVPGKLAVAAVTARVILLAALQGNPDDAVGKTRAAAETPETIVSQPPPSSETAS